MNSHSPQDIAPSTDRNPSSAKSPVASKGRRTTSGFAPRTFTKTVYTIDELERLVYDAITDGHHTFKAIVQTIPAESHENIKYWLRRVYATLERLCKQRLLKNVQDNWYRR